MKKVYMWKLFNEPDCFIINIFYSFLFFLLETYDQEYFFIPLIRLPNLGWVKNREYKLVLSVIFGSICSLIKQDTRSVYALLNWSRLYLGTTSYQLFQAECVYFFLHTWLCPVFPQILSAYNILSWLYYDIN